MNMFRSNIIPLISACSVGIGAFLGAKYESMKTRHRPLDSASDLRNSYSVDISSFFPWSISDVYASSIVPVNSNQAILNSSNINEIMKFGFPSLENLRTFDDFVLAYDRRNRNANWVFEHLTPNKLPHKGADRSKSDFFEDEKIHTKFRSYLRDFKHSGYDRGHLAAAGNHRHSQKAMDETFTLSNISPQVGEGFNRGIWNELEKYVRSIARKSKNTYVCTGPLYLPRQEADGKMYVKFEVIGQTNIAVPTHFFKVIAIETNSGEFELLSFVLPNRKIDSNTPLKTFLTPLDAIERSSGLLIFDRLPKNKIISVNNQKHGRMFG